MCLSTSHKAKRKCRCACVLHGETQRERNAAKRSGNWNEQRCRRRNRSRHRSRRRERTAEISVFSNFSSFRRALSSGAVRSFCERSTRFNSIGFAIRLLSRFVCRPTKYYITITITYKKKKQRKIKSNTTTRNNKIEHTLENYIQIVRQLKYQANGMWQQRDLCKWKIFKHQKSWAIFYASQEESVYFIINSNQIKIHK